MLKSAVIWLTGLPASGKTTLGDALFARLKAQRHACERLDGDMLREIFPTTGFSRDARDRHVRSAAWIASLLERNGITAIASFISPYAQARADARKQCQRFIEVYLATPVEVCERRDPKGLYRRARAGEITCFTGVNDPYEIPLSPELIIDTSKVTIDEAVSKILDRLGVES